MSSDPFADLLRLTEATSVVSGGVSAGGRWSLRFPAFGQIVFSAITAGGCWLRLGRSAEPVRLEAGDLGLLSGREGFVLCSDVRARPVDVAVDPDNEWGDTTVIGDGSGCTWLAGRVALHPVRGELLRRALPAFVHLRADSAGAASLRWIIHELVDEHAARRPGASVAVAQLAQLMFVKMLRAHLAGDGALLAPGWLRAASDEQLARALRLVHTDPARSFGLDELARAAGMSRTRFATRFKALAGTAPLAYVTQWRMQLAQRALRDETVSIAELAASLGYASDSAFSNAFKRVTGSSPSAYRAERTR